MPFKNKEEKKAYDKAYYEANKEKFREQEKAYRQANKEKLAEQKKAYYEANKEQRKAYYEANKEKLAEQKKAYRQANKEKFREQEKAYRQANKEKIAKRMKAYHEANKEQRKAHYEANKERILDQQKSYKKQRRKSDPLFRLIFNYRHSCIRAFNSINQQKNVNSLKLLDLNDWRELAEHLSKQFYNHPETGEEMTFDNHGYYGWHIDHIIPLSTAKTEEEIIKLCHYTNLQPMWAEENIAKSNKILDTQ